MDLVLWCPLMWNTKNYGSFNIDHFSDGGSQNIQDGPLGKCLYFDNANKIYLSMNNNSFYTEYINNKSFSVSLWIKTSESNTSLFAVSYGFRILLESGKVRFLLTNSNFNIDFKSNLVVNDSKWHHICAIYDNRNFKANVYIDGKKDSISSSESKPFVVPTDWYCGIFIGHNPNNNLDYNYYKGWMSDVRFYDDILSTSQIYELSKGLLLHYDFEDPLFESTKNLIKNDPLPSNMTCWGNNNSVVSNEKITVFGLPYDQSKKSIISANGGGGFDFVIKSVEVEPNTTYTLSLYLKQSENLICANNLYRYEYDKWNGTRLIEQGIASKNNREYIGDGWYRYYGTFTTQPSTKVLTFDYFTYPSSDQYEIYYQCGQIEKNNHMTPFTLNTRNINSLINNAGYNLNITKIGDLQIWKDAPVGNYSLKTKKNTNIQVSLPSEYIGNKTNWTISWWGKTSSIQGKMAWGINSLNLYPTSNIFCWNTADSANNPFKDSNGKNVSSSEYSDNKWHHYAITTGNSQNKLYIDGIYRGTAITYRTINNNILQIGGWPIDHNYDWDGCLDDFRLYGTTLSDKDIEILYHSSSSVSNLGDFQTQNISENLSVDNSNLIFNGNLELHNNLGFNAPYDENLQAIKFSHGGNAVTTPLVEINDADYYKFSFDYYLTQAPTSDMLLTVVPYDRNKEFIEINQTNIVSHNTETTLAKALYSGDTTVSLTDGSKWTQNGGENYYRQIGFCTNDAYQYNMAISNIRYVSISNNIATLANAYSGPTMPAGTRVAQFSDGGTFYYPMSIPKNTPLNKWYHKSTLFRGYNIRYGTKYAKFGILPYSGTVYLKNIRFENQWEPQLLKYDSESSVDIKFQNNTSIMNTIEIGMKIRYIKDEINGSTANSYNHWVEIQAFNTAHENILFGTVDNNGSYQNTNNNTSASPYDEGGTYRQFDIGYITTIEMIKIWHYWGDNRTYHNNKVSVSSDGINWIKIFDSDIDGEYAENAKGHEIYIYPNKFSVEDNGNVFTHYLEEK